MELHRQNQDLPDSDRVKANIELLREDNAFTVTAPAVSTAALPVTAGLALWLDATDVNGDGSTPNDGDIISTWGPYDQFAIYVEFEGTLQTGDSSGYGFEGQYDGLLLVERVATVTRRRVGNSYPPAEFWGCTR